MICVKCHFICCLDALEDESTDMLVDMPEDMQDDVADDLNVQDEPLDVNEGKCSTKFLLYSVITL